MAGSALTPRVRVMVVCDKARASRTESGVFDLRGVRQEIAASHLPYPARLWLFLVLTSPRNGVYPAYVLVVNDETDKTIFYAKLEPTPTFQDDTEFLAILTRIRCTFPKLGRYTIQLWFFQAQGSDILKGQVPFRVLQKEV